MVNGIGTGITVGITIQAVDKFSSIFNKAGIAGKALGAAMTGAAIAVVGIGAAIDSILSSTIQLETAMVGVAKTTGLASKEINELRRDFVDLSKTMPLTATELATIGEVAGQLGIVGSKNILDFTEVVAKMSIATELTAEGAAIALAKLSNAFNLPIQEVELLGSAINELSNVSAASSTEIINAMVRTASSAATLGLSAENISAMTAALIASGEPAERAGTKLRSAFDSVIKKLKEASDFMQIDFKQALEQDANGAILSLINRISEIESPVERQKTAMDIFGTVGASAINKISNNIPEMNRLIAVSTAEFQNAASLQNEYDKAIESTASKLQILKNGFTSLKLEMGEALLPVFRDLVEVLQNDLLPALLPLIPQISKFLVNALKLVAPLLKFFIDRMSMIADVIVNDILPAIQPLIDAFMEIGKIVGPLLRDIFESILQVIKSLIPHIASLFTAIIPVIASFLKLIDAMLPLVETILITFINLLQRIMPSILKLIDAITPLITSVLSFIDALMPLITDVLDVFIDLLVELAPFILDIFEALKPVITTVLELVQALLPLVGMMIKSLLPVFKAWLPLINDLFEMLIPIIIAVAKFSVEVVQLVANISKSLIPVFKFLLKVIQPIIDAIEWLINLITKVIGLFNGLFKSSSKAADVSSKFTIPETQTSTSRNTSSSRSSSRDSTRNFTPIPNMTPIPRIDTINRPIIKLNDFIMTPRGQIIKPSPQDTIIGTKSGFGTSIVINIDTIQGTDPEDMMEAFERELKNKGVFP